MRELICGLAIGAMALGAAPAMAGTAETAFLGSLVGSWSGSGAVKGPQTGEIACSLRFSPSGGGVAFSGKCTNDLGPPRTIRGAIAYNDKTKRYEATSQNGLSIGTKGGSGVTFVSQFRDPMMGSGTSTMKVAATRITIDTTIVSTMVEGKFIAHVVMTK